MKLAALTEPVEALDPFDPRTWCAQAAEPCYLHLSDRFDVYALVDPEDYAWASAHRWCHTYGSGEMVEIGGVTLYLHREILIRRDGPPRGRRVGDHKNGLTLDCRRANLRWATPSQNARNVVGSKTRARFLRAMGAG